MILNLTVYKLKRLFFAIDLMEESHEKLMETDIELMKRVHDKLLNNIEELRPIVGESLIATTLFEDAMFYEFLLDGQILYKEKLESEQNKH